MQVLDKLLVAAAIAMGSISLAAQESLPNFYLQRLATIDRLLKLTSTDLADLISRAHSGTLDAQYQLAMVYGAGRIVPQDKALLRHWMLKSAEQGYVPAEAGIGVVYLDEHLNGRDPNYADGERWLRLAATHGDAEAQLWLGVGYERGYFGGIDYQESLKWLRKSADQGHPDAQFCLGQMYEEGKGTPKNDKHAAYWFRRAADHYSDLSGVFQAEAELAYMYRGGRLKEDNVEAYMWFAIVGSRVSPPTDEDIKEISKSMTPPQIAEAQQKADQWIAFHPPRPR